jgi:hypothetical protein
VLPAVFVNYPFFPVIEQNGVTVDPFQVDILLLFSFQRSEFVMDAVWLKLEFYGRNSHDVQSKELTFF